MFSVLLSLYHKEKPEYLEKCFESIWDNQSLKPSEIVLVLDGPIGEQLTTSVQEWQVKIAEKLKVVALPQNVGLGKALNEGLKQCSADWVFRMDT
ncbi:MAG: glycosyltransferase, partial [Staphylococcus sp.]|nr:glycosyltransferase [Staphylococcus sp.]